VVCATTAEAIAAVDRLITTRLERNLCDAAALAARCLEHFASGTTTAAATATAVRGTSRFPSGTALRATAWLVGEALHREELLLPGRKRELRSAVNASEHFICVHERANLLRF
jgi:hypothetical protein